MSVVIFDEKESVLRELQMERETTGYYSMIDSASSAGTLYKYRLDGEVFPDIASRFQPQGVHGPSQVVDGRSFRWTDFGWKSPALHELVIYELHVGTFTPEGTFEAIITRFDHLKRIGVNAHRVDAGRGLRRRPELGLRLCVDLRAISSLRETG